MKQKSNKKLIAVTILVSIILTLLLSCNFRIWSGVYCEGDLESTTVEQELLIARAYNNIGVHHTSTFHIPVCSVPADPGILPVFIFISVVTFVYFEFRQCITLCSLSVRMDN